MWTCSKCGRSFRNANQNRTCILMDKESLFQKHSPALKVLYKKIYDVVKKFVYFREETVRPDVIFFKRKSTFLGVKVKKDHLEIEYFLEHPEDIPHFVKYLRLSKHRVTVD